MPSDSNEQSESRREFIRKSSAFSAAGLTVGVAGCAGDDEDDGNGIGHDPDEELGEKVEELEFSSWTQSRDPIRFEGSRAVTENMRELGFEVDFTTQEETTLVERVFVDRDYEITHIRWGGNPERVDPQTFVFDLNHSSQAEPGARNVSNWRNEEYDELAEAQMREMDRDRRQELIYECQEIFNEEKPHTTYFSRHEVMAYNSDRYQNPAPIPGDNLFNFYNFLEIEPREGVSDLSIGRPTLLDNFRNPFAVIGTHDWTLNWALFDTLVRINTDLEVEPWLAEDWEVEDDTTISMSLAGGAEFSDGEPLTTEDVKFTYEAAKEYSATLGGAAERVDEIEIIDEQDLVFHLTEPFAPIFVTFFSIQSIVPKHIWEDVDNPATWDNPDVISSGVWEFESWTRGEEMVATANEDHFKQTPNADRLIWVPAEEMSTLVNMMEQGELDVLCEGLTIDQVDILEQTDHVETHQAENHGVDRVHWNTDVEPLDDVEVRRALSHAVPKEEILETVGGGFGEVHHSFISPATEFWHNPDLEPEVFDLERAREILAEAGYGWDEDGYLHYPPDE